jgi:hypothetical protein
VGADAVRRLPFQSVRIDTEDVPITEAPLGQTTDGYGVSGETDTGKGITVEPRALYASMLIAVFDEALHQFWSRSQLNGRYVKKTEEFVVHELSPYIREFLLDNPEWVDEWRRVNGK